VRPAHAKSGWLDLLAVLLAFLGACQESRQLAPGQIWAYDNRSGEGASTIEILHVERGTPLGDVFFVSVKALDVHRLGRKISTTEVWPLAFTREALTKSLRTYQWSQKVDRSYFKQLDFWWREAREGRAGERTFNVPVKEALDQIQSGQPDAERRLFGDVV
jgi:hypothetical protein